MDVIWSGYDIPNDGNNYYLRVNVNIDNLVIGDPNPPDLWCVEQGFTIGSLHPALSGETFIVTNYGVDLTASDIGALNLNPLSPMTLFSIYFVGAPPSYVTFNWDTDANGCRVMDFNDINNIIHYPCNLSSQGFDFFPARTVSGSIYKAPITQSNCNGGDNAAVTGVDVNLFTNVDCSPAQQNQAMVNQNDGTYAFTVNENFNYTIAPTKTNNPGCGVNTTDYLMAWQHANGSAPFQYPWQAVAADMNLDNTVTLADVIGIINLINGNFEEPHGWASWTFPTALAYGFFPPVTPFGYYYPDYDEYISITNLNSDWPNQDFAGIKRADVDGSCSDCDGEFQGGGVEDRSYANAGLRFTDQPMKAGAEVELPVYFTGGGSDLAALAFALELPAEHFEILTVRDGSLPGLREGCFNWRAMDGGLLRFAWLNMEGQELNISENDPLFYIAVRAKQDIRSLEGLLRLRPDIQDCSMASPELERSLLALEFSGEAPVTKGVSVFPNPVRDDVTIGFDVTAGDASILLYLYGTDGRTLAVNEYHFPRGRQSITLPTDGLPNGLVSYQLHVGGSRYAGKFFKQD